MTYWPANVGPYVWHEFNAERVSADLRQIAATGHRFVRTLLSWDAFMASPSVVSTARLRDLERFLDMAAAQSLHVVPVLFVQSAGDSVLLPTFAIDVNRARRGVRVVTDGVVQPGGPRDVYTGRVMLEAAVAWSEAMVSAFARHPAIAWWDMGHDPAATVRPRRTAHLHDWLRLVTQIFRDAGERCALTLGAGDLVSARAVRPAALAPHVDVLGFELDPCTLPFGVGDLDVTRILFITQLAQRLSELEPLHVHLSVCERADTDAADDARCMSEVDAQRFGADAVDALTECGCAGLFASQWSRPSERVIDSPPFDRVPSLAQRGVVDAAAHPTRFGASWSGQIARDRDLATAHPWPAQLDAEAFYANLPDSLQDLYAAWRRERQGDPAMLG